MKRFHHYNRFTLNERRFVYETPEANLPPLPEETLQNENVEQKDVIKNDSDAKNAAIKRINEVNTRVNAKGEYRPVTPKLTADMRDQGEQVDEGTQSPENQKEPTTHGERLEQDMRNAMKELQSGTDATAKLAALIKVLGCATEYMQRAFTGKLGEALDKKPEPNAPAGTPPGTPENTPSTAAETPAQSAQRKLDDNAKPQPNKEVPKDLAQNIEQVKEKNQKERESNTAEMKELDDGIGEAKKENDTFIDQRSVLEKQLNGLQGTEGSESKQQTLKDKIDAVNKKIEANKELITKLDARRDGLEAKNKRLDEEDKELDKKKESVGDAMKKAKELMGVITKAVKESGLAGDLPTFDVELNKEGKPVITVTGGSAEIRAMIQQQAEKNKWPIEMREGTASNGNPAPEQQKEAQPSANEIQNRRLMIVSGQIKSLSGDGVTIKGSAYTGAEFQTKDGQQFRYDTKSQQWQVKSLNENVWQDPSNYAVKNADIASKLRVFKIELDGLRKQEDDANKREQTA